jgi:hypothetical protein
LCLNSTIFCKICSIFFFILVNIVGILYMTTKSYNLWVILFFFNLSKNNKNKSIDYFW